MDTSAPSALTDALAQLDDAAEALSLEPGVHAMLAAPRRELTVSIPLRRDDGPAARPRAGCATARTWISTRCGHSRCG
jgi:glutamate dehydrogenase/leucine dehydrogenase